MKKQLIVLLAGLYSLLGHAEMIEMPETPASYKVLAQVTGDLNKDGIVDLVIAYDTARGFKDEGMGTVRELRFYQNTAGHWALWHVSEGPILPSQHGGMMGDPFYDGLKIENGSLVVENSGGSRQKWGYTHRYRFQNGNWYLIGAKIGFGAPCDFFGTYDYNFSTGKLIVDEESFDVGHQNCGVSKTKHFILNRKLKHLIKMDGFYPGNNEVKLPKSKDGSFYF